MVNLEDQILDQVFELLIVGLFFYLFGEELFGYGINYFKQYMCFEEDVCIGEMFIVIVIIIYLCGDKVLVNLDILCIGEDGWMICVGDVLVLF